MAAQPLDDEVRAKAVAVWSMSHGLVTLLNDSPLKHKVGTMVDRTVMGRAAAEQCGMVSSRKES